MKSRRTQSGFTLVEVMIGLVLGLFIVIALITLLINVNRNNNELAKSNRVIENGRIAMQLITADLQHAGFLAGFVPNYDTLAPLGRVPVAASGNDTAGYNGHVPTAVPDPCLAYNTGNWTNQYIANLLGVHAAAYQVSTSGSVPVCTSIINNPKASTHVLVVRHAEPCEATSTGSNECLNDSTATNPHLYFQASRCATDSNSFGTMTFVVSNVAANLNQRTRACSTALAPLYRWASTIYYVRTYASTAGDGIPTLMRSQFGLDTSNTPAHQAAQPLVEGIEAMVVQFGLDNKSQSGAAVVPTAAVTWAVNTTTGLDDYNSPLNRGDGNPDEYVTCTSGTPCTVAQLMHAVTAKVHLLVRGESVTAGHTDNKTYYLGDQTFGPFNDGYKRHVFTQTVRLTNVSGRRETP